MARCTEYRGRSLEWPSEHLFEASFRRTHGSGTSSHDRGIPPTVLPSYSLVREVLPGDIVFDLPVAEAGDRRSLLRRVAARRTILRLGTERHRRATEARSSDVAIRLVAAGLRFPWNPRPRPAPMSCVGRGTRPGSASGSAGLLLAGPPAVREASQKTSHTTRRQGRRSSSFLSKPHALSPRVACAATTHPLGRPCTFR